MQGNALLQAVIEGDIEKVRQAAADEEPDASLLVEAHLQARMKIVEFFQSRVEALRSRDVVPDVLQVAFEKEQKCTVFRVYCLSLTFILHSFSCLGSVLFFSIIWLQRL